MNFTDRTQDVRFFKGLEVEKTKFFLLPTLIAPDCYDASVLIRTAREHGCENILLGYMVNSAQVPLVMDVSKALSTVNALLDAGFKVTVEIRPDQLTDDFVAGCPDPEGKYGEQFVILIGMHTPNMSKVQKFATLKLHDDFAGPNHSVQCLEMKDFLKHAQPSPWGSYTFDQIIK